MEVENQLAIQGTVDIPKIISEEDNKQVENYLVEISGEIKPIEKNLVIEAIAQADKYLSEARTMVIEKHDEAQLCVDKRNDIKNLVNSGEDARLNIARPINKKLSALKAMFDIAQGKLIKAKGIYDTLIEAWSRDQARIAQEVADKLKKQQEEEARKLELKAQKAAEKGNAEKAEILRQEAELKKNITRSKIRWVFCEG